VLRGDAQPLADRTSVRERAAAVEHLELDLPEGEAPVGVHEQRPRQQARLAEHLKAVADPQHETAVARELDHRLHRRREPRDRPRAQVVAVGEAPGHDDRVGTLQIAVAVPQELRVGDLLRGVQRVDLVAGAGKLKNAELHLEVAASAETIS
jgi:hypothetical protein